MSYMIYYTDHCEPPEVGWLVERLTSPFSTKNRLYQGQGLGRRPSSAR